MHSLVQSVSFNVKRSEAARRVQFFVTPWTVAYQAPHPWDFPGKSTRVIYESEN